MARRYRIRVYGKARENPDLAMLAQIVVLIGRRLHAEQLRRQAVQANGDVTGAEDTTQEQAGRGPSRTDSDTGSGQCDGGLI